MIPITTVTLNAIVKFIYQQIYSLLHLNSSFLELENVSPKSAPLIWSQNKPFILLASPSDCRLTGVATFCCV